MFKLLQVNIAGANARLAPAAARLNRLAAQIEAVAADCVVVQAGRDTAGSDAPLDLLIAQLPDHIHIARDSGVAILSRRPLERTRSLPLRRLPGTGDDNDRVVVIAQVPELALFVVAAHFSWVDEQAAQNVVDTIAALDRDLGHEAGDVVLAGDLNQQPASDALKMLGTAGFVDSWARLQHGKAGPTFEVGNLWGRIDYILERSKKPRVVTIKVIGADPSSSVSDHAMLVAGIA